VDIGYDTLGFDQEGGMRDDGDVWTVTVWRPKECITFRPPYPWKPDSASYPPVSDPLILDLKDDGIRTLGLHAGIHFDHDSNDFKELTGWVAQGDGILMLDVNGNGCLDDGGELLGDSMFLANGRPAANGFQALAQYDSNKDGRIDGNDPVWSQLGVWQHETYIPPAGGG
jgi:hypothetical protein